MRHGLQYAALVAFGLILTTPAQAVSVGDIRPQSAIGEPLVVDIAVVDTDGISDSAIQITPATAADHALLGMQRPVWLDQMRFTTQRDDNGQLVVRGQAPILPTAAAQNFLVQLSWPGNVRLQQVAVNLMENPTTPSPAKNDVAVASSAESTFIATQPATPEPMPVEAGNVIATQPAQAANIPVPIVERPAQTRSGPISVRRGDTLSQIASEWDQDLSLFQRQQIIREANPKAFIDGSINQLRADVRLQLPDPATIDVPTEAESNRWYRQALKQAQRVSNPVVVAPETAEPEAVDEPNLTLIAPGQGEGEAAGTADTGADVATALADAKRERADALATRDQLRQRLATLTQESAAADQRLAVLDDRLAAFDRGEMPSLEEAAPTPADEAATTSDNTWLWWLLAAALWLVLLVVWLRQRAQRQVADHEAARTEPVVEATPEAPVAVEPPAEHTFDDSFADLAPSAAALGEYDAAPAEEEEYDFLSDSDAEAFQTRLDLAQAYLDMNEDNAARELLERVLEGGSSDQRVRAQELLNSIG